MYPDKKVDSGLLALQSVLEDLKEAILAAYELVCPI